MRGWGCSKSASLAAVAWATHVLAWDLRQDDGVNGIEAREQITGRAVLVDRADDNICGTSLKLCPSDLGGGCCPENYDCGTKSCFATSRGPSTCGTLVGWHACDAVHGGGCCPDGYDCERAGNCVPPSGSPYTFGCPKSHYLCPSSASYGCCPDHMGCGVNQCYSTEPKTITTTETITTKRNGKETTVETTGTTVSTPAMPAKTQNINANMDEDDQVVFKYFPSAQAKVAPTASSEENDGGSSGLSKGQLGGIVAGAVIFLAIILICAFFIIRRLNSVAAAVSNSGNSKQSDGSKPRPQMKQFRPTDSEIDALSVDPLMMSPQPSHARPNQSPDPLFGYGSPDPSSNPTPSTFAGGYQPVSTPGDSRHTSVDAAGNVISYFEYPANQTTRHSHGSGPTPPGHRGSADTQQTSAYQHLRSWSNASETSEEGYKNGSSAMELDGSPYVPELVGSPTIGTTESDERRASSGSVASTGMTRPPLAHQRRRSDGKQGIRSDSGSTPNILGVLSEEIHGFHGPTDHMAGQTEQQKHTRDARGEESSGSQNDAKQRQGVRGTENISS